MIIRVILIFSVLCICNGFPSSTPLGNSFLSGGPSGDSSFQVCLMLAVASVCLARPSDPYHAPPGYHEPIYKEDPKPYSFSYGVADGYHTVDFGKTMTYNADHNNGYNAQGEYYGEAQYPPFPYESGPPITFTPPPGYTSEPVYKPVCVGC